MRWTGTDAHQPRPERNIFREGSAPEGRDMNTKRIGLNLGGGYVPGINAVITGVVLAAGELRWDVVGIRDGFDGLLFPSRYREGGLLNLTPGMVEALAGSGGALLGNATRTDPFHV